MNIKFFYLNLLLIIPAITTCKTVVDCIRATIYFNGKSKIITSSMLAPGLAGAPKTLNEVVINELKKFEYDSLVEAKAVGPIEADEVDKHLATIQKMNNLTKDKLLDIIEQQGLTWQEMLDELKEQLTIQRATQLRLQSKINISEEEILKYYNNNPKETPASYAVAFCVVPFEPFVSKEKQKKDLNAQIKDGSIKTSKLASWESKLELTESDIAENKNFIKTMPTDSIIITDETDEGFGLLWLVSKKEKTTTPLSEIKDEIRRTLWEEKHLTAELAWQDELKAKAKIVYTGK